VTRPLFEPFARGGRAGFGRIRWNQIFTLEPYTDGGDVSTLLSLAFVPLMFWGASRAEHVLGAVCWAIGMGAQESIFKAAIARLVDKARRSRAYGGFYALFGLAWWVGSTFMGWLYERSLSGLVVFSVGTQLLAVPIFFYLGQRLKQVRA